MSYTVPSNDEFNALKAQVEALQTQLNGVSTQLAGLVTRSELDSGLSNLGSALQALTARVSKLEGGTTPAPNPTKPKWGYSAANTSALTAEYPNLGTPKIWRKFFPGLPDASAWTPNIPVIVSFKTNPTGAFPTDTIRTWLKAKPAGLLAYVCVYHEPEDNSEGGAFTVDQWKTHTNALAALCREFQNCYSTAILMEWTLNPNGRNKESLWCDGLDCDVLGFDVYPKISEAASGYAKIDRALLAGYRRRKPVLIAEIGDVVQSNDQTRADWMTALANYINTRSLPPVAVTWFNSTTGGDYRLNTAPTRAATKAIVA